MYKVLLEEKIKKINNIPLGISFYKVKNFPPHFHEEFLEIILCLKGSVTLLSADQKIELYEGDIFSIDSRDIHYLYSEKDNIVMSLYIDLREFENQFPNLQYNYFTCRSDNCSVTQTQPMQDIKNRFLAIAYFHLNKDISITNKKFSTLSTDIIKLLLCYFDWFHYMNPYQNPSSINRERFNRILIYCQKNFSNKITISDIAKNEFMNKNYISQFLAKSPFKSFSNMINYIRCYESEYLLTMSNLSNRDIAYECGFSDPKYYYKHFKRWYGHTPNDHRNMINKQLNTKSNVTPIDDKVALYELERYIAKYHCLSTI